MGGAVEPAAKHVGGRHAAYICTQRAQWPRPSSMPSLCRLAEVTLQVFHHCMSAGLQWQKDLSYRWVREALGLSSLHLALFANAVAVIAESS